MTEQQIAVDEGRYGFDGKKFTGMIVYGENEAMVKNARFYLKKINGIRSIGWLEGTWINGTFSDGMFLNGIWKNGTWKGGIWKNGIWKNGIWEKGLWENGTWEKGEGNRFSKNNSCFLIKNK